MISCHMERPAVSIIGVFCIFFCICWLFAHLPSDYRLKIDDASDQRGFGALVVCKASWWGMQRQCYPVRYARGWEIYQDGKWHILSSGIEYSVFANEETTGMLSPPNP